MEPFKPSPIKARSRRGSPIPGMPSSVVNLNIDEARSQALHEQLGSGAVPVGGTDPLTGARFENPQGSAQVESAKIEGQKLAETASPRAIMRDTLVKAKQLADTVPPPQKGIQRLIQGSKNTYQGATGEIPQIQEFNNMIDSSLGAFGRTMFLEKGAQSDRDISRIKKSFSDIAWDTEDQRALGWNRAIDTYNNVIGTYKNLQNEKIDKRELLSPKEIGRATFLSGANKYDDLSDEELEGLFDGDVEDKRMLPFLENAIVEYEKRGLHQKDRVQ